MIPRPDAARKGGPEVRDGGTEEMDVPLALAIHGGAWNIPDEMARSHAEGIERALREVWAGMQRGLAALDAVELAVRLLEDDTTFNGGRGAHLNREYRVELDASIMEGSKLEAGAVAAATSTGGTQDKSHGRVGDSPVIGAGTYADDRAGAASSTGWGEGILRVVLAKAAVDGMRAGAEPASAGRSALAALRRVRGSGGLILVDRRGRVAAVFNTPRMARGIATEAGGIRTRVSRGGGRR